MKRLLAAALFLAASVALAQDVPVTTSGIVSITNSLPPVYNGQYVMQTTDFGFLWLDSTNLTAGLVQAQSKCDVGLPAATSNIYATGDCNGTGDIVTNGSVVLVHQFNSQCGASTFGCGGANTICPSRLKFNLGTWTYRSSDHTEITPNGQTTDLQGRTWTVTPTDFTGLHFNWHANAPVATNTPTVTPTTSGTVTATPTVTPTPTPTSVPSGLSVTKSCAPPTITGGDLYTCSFTVTNLDTGGGVTGLVVYDQHPDIPTFPTGPWQCFQFGGVVTALGARGSPTDTCSGTTFEIAPACNPGSSYIWHDYIQAIATDTRLAAQVVGTSVCWSETILACGPATNTPTVTPTATLTRTPTPTLTPTLTPTSTITPTPTVTPTGVTMTPTNTPTETPTTTPTNTHTPTPTVTPTNTPTVTPTPLPTTLVCPSPPFVPTTTPTPSPTPGAFLSVTKACPQTARVGTIVQCTFVVTNLDNSAQVTDLTVTNAYPLFTHRSAVWACGAANVRVLGRHGTPTDTCRGTLNEIMDVCDSGNRCRASGGIPSDHTVTDTLTAKAHRPGLGWTSNSTTATITMIGP